MNVDTILNISKPELLFTKDNIKGQFHDLALKWHPDKCAHPKSSEVFSHIKHLYDSGLDKIKKGYWNTFGFLEVKSVAGKMYNIRYKIEIPFELGTMYVSDTIVLYKVRKEFEPLHKSFIDNVAGLKYSTDKMKTEFTKYLPNIITSFETSDSFITVLKKTKDVLPLSVVLKYFGGSIDPKGVAWIISSMLNLHCFLQFNGLVHNNIDINTYFVSPELHSGLLLGGWWYTKGVGEPLKSVPTKTFEYMSVKSKANKTADRMVDGELIRSLARKLLGDEAGMSLISKYKVPKDMVMWLRLSGSKSAVNDYRAWRNEILPFAFGERKFTPMNVDIPDAYDKFIAS